MINIPATNRTPLIAISTKSTIQRIEGISIPIDAYEFYKPITDYLNQNRDVFTSSTEFHFKLNYYNTSSSKALFILLQTINQIKKEHGSLKIVWEYDDDNEFMLESGQEFSELLDCEFQFEKLAEKA